MGPNRLPISLSIVSSTPRTRWGVLRDGSFLFALKRPVLAVRRLNLDSQQE